ncbi:RHS repeat-associated core domain-containing protein [Catellatospora coxensis]|uniref:Teneurin-like YD-shell domain-containing protein n=2 Tax=Catellatospora coxensis TaxID=310354 RepID=A0A8J3P7L3_9ACTN|nr:hypothetical protein Cco03nite_14660 [Catellatospora coxensis]
MGLAQVPAQAAPGGSGPAPQAQRPAVRGQMLPREVPRTDRSAANSMVRADRVKWPAGGSVEFGIVSGRPMPQSIGGMTVKAEPPKPVQGVGNKSADTTPQRVRVSVVERDRAQRAGLDGPLVTVSRADERNTTGRLRLTLDYAPFAHAVGGDWGARLRLVQLPTCAQTDPSKPECRTGKWLASTNDAQAQAVSAEIEVPSAGSAPALFALTAGDASSQGDYSATKLSPSSSWSTAKSTGGFSWSYPIRVPQTPSGFGPQITLGYSSQSVDGRTAASNNQGSWIGEGFSYEPGYIERRYKPCADDGHETSGDQCWAFHNGMLVLGERSGTLVKVSDRLWKLSNDDGSKVERLDGTTNGDDNGEYWKITTTDGTQYFFGQNRLPGWSQNKEETNSVWTVPVFGDDANEPCNKTAGFADSFCDQAWRWNLDHVIDPRGNVMSYFYERETNYYARGARTDVDGAAYHRGGWLARIDYGQRQNEVYTTNAPARVVFTTTERCIPGGALDCDPQDLNEDTAASWPDVPEDRLCLQNTHCEYTQTSPTYFTRKRLTKIETEIREASDWTLVESWKLEHEFKTNDDNSRTLWLKKLIHAGHRGGTETMPAVEFEGIQLPNRVDSLDDAIGALIRYRLAGITTDSGSQITINYKASDCEADQPPAEGQSTKRCYPVKWNPFGGGEDDRVTDWFNKYVVENVIEDDLVGGNPDMVTAYEYVGDAAWRKAEPDGFTKAEDLTWSDWRGYSHVIVRKGDGQVMAGRTEHYFLRGLSGGKKADGTTPVVTVGDSTGKTYTDYNELVGHELETVLYNGSDIVTKTINEPWRHVTRTQSENWGSSAAVMVRSDVVRSYTALPDNAQGQPVWRETKKISKYDTTWGRLESVDDLGEPGADKLADDICTRTYYVDNPDTYMYSYVSRTQSVSVSCSDTTPDYGTELLADQRTSYDLRAWNEPPLKGTVTRAESLDRFDGTTILHIPTTEATAVDVFGRSTAVKDARGYTTTTQYTEMNGLTVTKMVTNTLGHSTTTTYDPAYSAPTVITDSNGRRTDITVDALGRITAVWMPDRDKSQGVAASQKFRYDVRTNNAMVVTTERLNNDGTYRTSHELFDGMLRSRQTQVPGPDGGWIVADTFYLGTGNVAKNNAPYHVLGVGGQTPLTVPESAVNGQTIYTYDDAGRTIVEAFAVAGVVSSVTTTAYAGDRLHIDPPDGGVPVTSVTDARGNATELHQYLGAAPSGAADVTRYTYTPGGLLNTITDPLGNTWDYDYNQRGQKVLVRDPDSGQTEYSYDTAGNVKTATSEQGGVISHKYDELGRKIETWQGAVDTGTKLSAWKYDTIAKGFLYYSARYTNNGTYFISYPSLDKLNRPLTTRYSIPSGDVGPILGRTYDFTTEYNTDGTVRGAGMPAAGGLPAESVVTSYDSLRRPISLTGSTSYVTSTDYGKLGELLKANLSTGGSGKWAALNWWYERGTGRLSRSTVSRQGQPVSDLDAYYSYDKAGNIKSIADTPVGGTRDVQCFSYDYLRRLVEAWANNSITKTCDDGVTETGVGGPAPYHQSWTFDKVGNRETETIHSITGGPATERVYGYPAQGPSADQPHTLRTVTESGPGGDKVFAYAYDDTGNTICRPAGTSSNTCSPTGSTNHQALTWDAEGHMKSSMPQGGAATNYVYDADGSRIVRKEPGGKVTLYLPGMELALTGSTVAATRSYIFADKTVAVRNSSGVYFQASDHHQTATCSINALTGSIQWRRTTPYGTSREGTPPTSWPDQKGFVGGAQDPTTSLIHLGAREYDPATGQFISIDPVIDPKAPQQLQGYAYGNNSPVTSSDPSGLWSFGFGDGIAESLKKKIKCIFGCSNPDANGDNKLSTGDFAVNMAGCGDANQWRYNLGPQRGLCGYSGDIHAGGDLAGDMLGANDYLYCIQGDLSACAWIVGSAIVSGIVGIAVKAAARAIKTIARTLKEVPEPKVGGNPSGTSGPWLPDKGVTPGGAPTQTTPGSCISACGQMLSNGALSEAELLENIGNWGNPKRLADELNKLEDGGDWVHSGFGSGEHALEAANRGPMGAVLFAPGNRHMVVIEPLGNGNFLVRDTLPSGRTYKVDSNWIKTWVVEGVFRN